jgi:uncharacterized heparinase superfamily protein
MSKKAMAKELEELAGKFSEGWHEGIKIDASDIMLLSQAAEALAQPEQEPVAYVTGTYAGRFVIAPLNPAMVLPVNMALYTTPQQRTWVGLTDEEYVHITDSVFHQGHGLVAYYSAIEAKLKEKNNGQK